MVATVWGDESDAMVADPETKDHSPVPVEGELAASEAEIPQSV